MSRGKKTTTVSVLFVCSGNICRSPTAEGVFRHLAKKEGLEHLLHIDSAGCHSYHKGEPPDIRAQEAAERRGYSLKGIRSRPVTHKDFLIFDYILAMDNSNLSFLLSNCPKGHKSKIKLFLDFAPAISKSEVPDPYYGGAKGFEHVLDLIEVASIGLLEEIKERLSP
ncbi:MAG: low molecular weight phosphotyrosine protein phosphatase [Candidatus Dadabacteria bacterium]|nr:MAG: low molecular weight phosphotyrosine protein phosphatase [Candidatus Dadabacteria bacterium]